MGRGIAAMAQWPQGRALPVPSPSLVVGSATPMGQR